MKVLFGNLAQKFIKIKMTEGNDKMRRIRFITEASIIAAIYVILTYLFAFMSYGPVQIRVAEALTVLPAFTPAAIPGLFVGCIVANILGGGGIYDIIFGSLTTLLAAYWSGKMPKDFLVPFPPVVLNGLIVGAVLHYLYDMPLFLTIGSVTLGQFVACYILGYPLIIYLRKYEDEIFRRNRQ